MLQFDGTSRNAGSRKGAVEIDDNASEDGGRVSNQADVERKNLELTKERATDHTSDEAGS